MVPLKYWLKVTNAPSIALSGNGRLFSRPVIEQLTIYQRYLNQRKDVLQRTVMNSFEQYVKLNNKIPPEVLTSLSGIEDPSRLADTIAAHMSLKVQDKQRFLKPSTLKSVWNV